MFAARIRAACLIVQTDCYAKQFYDKPRFSLIILVDLQMFH